MTSEAKLPVRNLPAVTQSETPCWTLVHADGRPVGFEDTEPHFDNEEQARRAAPSYVRDEDDDRPAPTTKQFNYRCFLATAECGYRYDEEGEGIEHHDDRDRLISTLLDAGWKAGPDGSMGCGEDSCDDCSKLPADQPLVEIPGQLALAPDVAPGVTRPDGSDGAA